MSADERNKTDSSHKNKSYEYLEVRCGDSNVLLYTEARTVRSLNKKFGPAILNY